MNRTLLRFLKFSRQAGIATLVLGGVYALNGYAFGDWLVAAGGILLASYCFLSAFEPVDREPDWTLVYPELAHCGMEDEDEENETEITKATEHESNN